MTADQQEINTRSHLSTGLTLRALGIGLVLSLLVGAVGPYLSLYIQGANASSYFTSQIALCLLFVLIVCCNGVLGAMRRAWVLQKGELLVVFILTSLANSTHVLVHQWVPVVASPFYYARSENNWLELINPHIPPWLAPRDPEAIRAFFEGTEGEAAGIPWQVWFEPIAGWLPMLVAMHVATLCLMVILRRRWVEHERLIYPVMQVPLAMVQDDERGSLIKPFFRNPSDVGRLCRVCNYRSRGRPARVLFLYPNGAVAREPPDFRRRPAELCHAGLFLFDPARGGPRAVGIHPAQQLAGVHLSRNRLGGECRARRECVELPACPASCTRAWGR